MNRPPLRVLTIFLRTGTDAYAGAESRLADLFARQMPDVQRDVVVVDNLLPPGVSSQPASPPARQTSSLPVAESSSAREVIGGDNSASEFSAIDAALAHVGVRIWHYDLVNIVTAAFEQLYVAYLERFTPAVLNAIAGQRVCVAHIDCYNEPIRVLGHHSQHWARTSFVMLPPAELMALGGVVSVRDRAPWFSGRSDAPFTEDAPLSETYRRYILDWLLGEDIGQGVRWHKTLSLDGDGLAVFERKAQAILNEHLFGVRLRTAGCRVIDVTWLSSELARGVTPDWSTPWYQQLANRDRDAHAIDPGSAPARVAAAPVVAADGQPEHDTNAAYDIETVEVMARLLRADSICLDIGAHEGSVLTDMIRLAPHGRHHAFEPLPHLAARLRESFPGVHIHQAAVSDAPGQAQYVYVENAPAYSGLREREYDRADPRKTLIDVEVVQIDKLIPADESIAFIKLDIEGGEYHALKGASETIRRCQPVIVFEASVRSTGQYGVTPEQMFGMLAGDFGYNVSTMRRWLRGQPPFDEATFARNWHQGPEYYFIAYP
ncbi:MAG: FkbM family methyltransferase [Acidobacteria bacterium]|nr:FkbM family methyltransferase [Acidobacteriota bacterium]